MYSLILPSGLTISLNTLGDIFHYLHRRRMEGEEVLLGKADNMEVWTSGMKCFPVVQRYSELGIDMADEGRLVEDIIRFMLDEVMPYALDDMGRIKAPWQMTSAQWGAINSIGSAVYGVIPCFTQVQCNQTCFNRKGGVCSIVEFMCSEFQARFGYGHNGPSYDGSQTNSRHKVHVAYALARGDTLPDAVMTEYQSGHMKELNFDLRWFPELLAKPYLRGRISADKLGTLLALLKGRGAIVREITEENAPRLISLMNQLPEDANIKAVDDLLFANDVLGPWPIRNVETDIGTPLNEFAARLRQMQVEARMKSRREHVDRDYAMGQMSVRERQSEVEQIKGYQQQEPYRWANRLAQAILDKNLVALVDILDGSNNETSQKAVFKHYGVKVHGLRAAERRRAVFTLCGYATDEQYQVAEATFKADQQARAQMREAEEQRKKAASRLEDTKAIAVRAKVRVDGVDMNGAEFVDKLIADGFNEIVKRKVGAVYEYRMQNTTAGRSYELKKSTGTLGYAQALLETQAIAA
jgi:hypothetical protein